MATETPDIDAIGGTSNNQTEWTEINKNGGIIVLRSGHQYTKKSDNKDGSTVWECRNRKSMKCPGAIKIKYLVSLFCCFPKIMYVLYNMLLNIKTGSPVLNLIVLGAEALQWGVIPCIPGLAVELTSADVENMKTFLLHQCLDCKDEKQRAEIREFLQYMEQRPFSYRIYRMITVNMSLPIGLFNLCTTYLIVIIQFTHLFG